MTERPSAVTFQGQPLTLVGHQLNNGDPAPGFTCLGQDLSEVSLTAYADKVKVIIAVPSLDTHVCDMEAKRFNQEAGAFDDRAVFLVVSMDLPFAQKRWADDRGISNVTTLSDHRDADFGQKWGVLIKELRLLARTVFVVDRDDTIRYIELVKEVTEEPDYDAALNAARSLL
jgi:thiol peroxidase